MFWYKTVPQGERWAVWHDTGQVSIVKGPARIPLWRRQFRPLKHHAASPAQYLKVVKKDGHTEHLPGPIEFWQHPVDDESVSVHDCIDLDSHHAVVVYQREGSEVGRRVIHGPSRFIPGPNEWLHKFAWHGSDPQDSTRKIPQSLVFTKLRTIPDQMYIDVPDVRTADDALVVIKLMVFFELVDIEAMLDRTHDPIADILNAITADIIDLVGRHTFEAFKEHTEALNHLESYEHLLTRVPTIGYRIGKVVYRGYHASDALQVMHNQAIETRTQLKLEDETERQSQELADLKLEREQVRERRQQDMAETKVKHENHLRSLQTEQDISDKTKLHQAEMAAQADRQSLEQQHQKSTNDQQLAFLAGIKQHEVDLTRYLVAQHQHPDRIIRIDGQSGTPVHVHDNEGR